MVDFYKYLFRFEDELFDEKWINDSSKKFEDLIRLRKFSIASFIGYPPALLDFGVAKKDLKVGFIPEFSGFFYCDIKKDSENGERYLRQIPNDEIVTYWFGIPLSCDFISENREMLTMYRVDVSQLDRKKNREEAVEQRNWVQRENGRPIDERDLDVLLEKSNNKQQLLTNLRGYILAVRKNDVIIDPFGLPYDVSDVTDNTVLGKIHRMLPNREIKRIVN